MLLPRISIVTPSYNQAPYLEATIQSVLGQEYPNLEYIIMDGGSTDGSVEIIRKYADHLAHWESAPDKGQADAINRGFARATGDILAWLNSDDTYEPGALQAVSNVFCQHTGTDLVYGEGWYMDASGHRLRPCKFVRPTFPYVYLVNRDPILQQAAFWRRSLWKRVGLLDTSLNWVFDWDWFIRAYKTGNFYYLPRFLSNYRIHPQAKTRQSHIRRRIEQRVITLRYGHWWYPNAVVQQVRIWEIRSPRLLRPLSRLMRFFVEIAAYGRYTT